MVTITNYLVKPLRTHQNYCIVQVQYSGTPEYQF